MDQRSRLRVRSLVSRVSLVRRHEMGEQMNDETSRTGHLFQIAEDENGSRVP